ncbi:aldo/keto reductase [Pseudovibrio sp. WM33]|uniref:aldo/keto reductase n=1 Tax=Pseudovibrio sp. WM33 TaxID=1735585 RepID=UPI0019D3EAEC|nr:aldo/keto reductase [Pseudovibrio sp. WM33]
MSTFRVASEKSWKSEKAFQMDMKTYRNDSVAVSRLGLGCMRMSMMPDQQRSESVATIHAALEAGINLLNTGDFYGQDGHNEILIGEALKSVDRDKAFISLKYGTFQNAFTGSNKVDVGPQNVKTYITTSLKRLGLDYVDLYQPARVDIGIPVEDTVGAIADLVEAGYVRNVGLSETDAETIRKAHATHPLSLVEFAYSITDTSIEESILPTARELGIGIVAFGAMGFGKLSDAKGDPLMVTLRHMAADKDISIAQLLHGWLLAKGEDIIPLAGARTTAQLEDTLQSLDLSLTDEDLNRIETARNASELVGRSMPNMVIKNGVLLEQD